MPISLPNFLQAETRSYGPGDLLGGLMQGYQASRMPAQMRNEELRQQLANRLLQEQGTHYGHLNEYYPRLQEQALTKGGLDIDLEKLKYEHPGLMTSSPEAQVLALAEILEKRGGESGVPTKESNALRDLSDRMIKKRVLDVERQQQINNYAEYAALPVDAQRDMTARAFRLGIPPEVFSHNLAQGKSLEDQAAELGIPKEALSKIRPKHFPTVANLTRNQRAQALNAERKVFEDKISEAMAPYSRKFFGYSPKQIAEGLANENPDGQAKYLAARALAPELAGIRWATMGGSQGIRAMEAVSGKALMNANTFEPLVSPEVYSKMNEYIADWMEEAYQSAQSATLGEDIPISMLKDMQNQDESKLLQSAQQKSPEQLQSERVNNLAKNITSQENQPGGTTATLIYEVDGVPYYVPFKEKEEFLEAVKKEGKKAILSIGSNK